MISPLNTLLAAIPQEVKQTNLPKIGANSSNLNDILQIAIGIIAAISLLFIVVGGLRYVLSDGDPQNASKAKSTIIYALIGLVIAISAQAIISFVLFRV